MTKSFPVILLLIALAVTFATSHDGVINITPMAILFAISVVGLIYSHIKYILILNKKIKIQDGMIESQNTIINTLKEMANKEHENYLEISLMDFLHLLKRDDTTKIMAIFANKNISYKENKLAEILDVASDTTAEQEVLAKKINSIIDTIA